MEAYQTWVELDSSAISLDTALPLLEKGYHISVTEGIYPKVMRTQAKIPPKKAYILSDKHSRRAEISLQLAKELILTHKLYIVAVKEYSNEQFDMSEYRYAINSKRTQ